MYNPILISFEICSVYNNLIVISYCSNVYMYMYINNVEQPCCFVTFMVYVAFKRDVSLTSNTFLVI